MKVAKKEQYNDPDLTTEQIASVIETCKEYELGTMKTYTLEEFCAMADKLGEKNRGQRV